MAWRAVGAAAPLVAASCAFAALSGREADPRGPLLATLAVATVAWGGAVWWLQRRWSRHCPAAAGPSAEALGRAVLLVALLVRLPLLFAAPTLSNDVWRYLWDGRVAASGANPYALPPDAAELAPLRDDRWRRLDHRGVATVYPPLALGSFSIAATTPRPLLAWKLFLTAAELAGCALLLALARRRGTPVAQVAWYAWSPLVAVEVAAMGHVDGLAVAPLVAAVLWLTPGSAPPAARRDAPEPATRPVLSALAAAAGILVKLAPLAALPLWARVSRRPGRYLAVALAVSAAGLLPVVAATGGVPPGITAYGVAWEFDGPLYEPLWRLLDAAGADHAAARAADAAKRATGAHDTINHVYPFLYPQILAKLLLAGGAAWVVACVGLGRRWNGRRPAPGAGDEDVATATGRLFGGLLLCSATVYPWYLLWVLPWVALDRHGPWLLAAALAPVAYLAASAVPGATGGPALFPTIWLAAWGPPALLALAGAARRARWAAGRAP